MNTRSTIRKATALLKDDEHEQAKELLERVLTENPDHKRARRLLAKCAQPEREKAEGATLQKARQAFLTEDYVRAQRLLDTITSEDPEYQKALELIWKIEGQNEEIEAESSQSSDEASAEAKERKQRESIEELRREINHLIDQRRAADARWTFEQAARVFESSLLAEIESVVRRAEIQEAKIHRQIDDVCRDLAAGNSTEADSSLELLRALDPHHPEVARLEKQIEDFRRIIGSEELQQLKQVESLRHEIKTLTREGLFQQAQAALQRLKKLAPTDTAQSELAEGLEKRQEQFHTLETALISEVTEGHFDTARRTLQKLEGIAPSHPRCDYLRDLIDEREESARRRRQDRLEKELESLLAEGKLSQARARISTERARFPSLCQTFLTRLERAERRVLLLRQEAHDALNAGRKALAKRKLAQARAIDIESPDRGDSRPDESDPGDQDRNSALGADLESGTLASNKPVDLAKGSTAAPCQAEIPSTSQDSADALARGPSLPHNRSLVRGPLSILGLVALVVFLWLIWQRYEPPPRIPSVTIPAAKSIQLGCLEEARDDGSCAEDEFPPKDIEYLAEFHLATTETSWRSYRICVEAGVCNPPTWKTEPPADTFPVTHVSWSDASTFCSWVGGRLPTELEWEWAARANPPGESPKLSPDKTNHGSSVCCSEDPGDGWAQTGPVNEVGINDRGLVGMAGNVAEWTSSQYSTSLQEVSSEAESGDLMTVRGGSWIQPPVMSRPSAREALGAVRHSGAVGFRCSWPEDPAGTTADQEGLITD